MEELKVSGDVQPSDYEVCVSLCVSCCNVPDYLLSVSVLHAAVNADIANRAGHVLTQITLTDCFRLRSTSLRWTLCFRGSIMTYLRQDTIVAACRNWWCSCSSSWRSPWGSR